MTVFLRYCFFSANKDQYMSCIGKLMCVLCRKHYVVLPQNRQHQNTFSSLAPPGAHCGAYSAPRTPNWIK